MSVNVQDKKWSISPGVATCVALLPRESQRTLLRPSRFFRNIMWYICPIFLTGLLWALKEIMPVKDWKASEYIDIYCMSKLHRFECLVPIFRVWFCSTLGFFFFSQRHIHCFISELFILWYLRKSSHHMLYLDTA